MTKWMEYKQVPLIARSTYLHNGSDLPVQHWNPYPQRHNRFARYLVLWITRTPQSVLLFISTAASGGAIAGAITNVTLTGAGIQLNLDSTALSAYNNQNLFINYNDVTGDQTTGILQASSGGADVASLLSAIL